MQDSNLGFKKKRGDLLMLINRSPQSIVKNIFSLGCL
jgi:hypothetical protein